MPKIIQFQTVNDDPDVKVIALCDDGTMWTLKSYYRGWWTPIEAEFPPKEDSRPSNVQDMIKHDPEKP